jgi:peptide/nickel transport system substrate-binding protein
MDAHDDLATLALTRRSLLQRAAGTGGALLLPGLLAGEALAAPAAGGTLTWGLSAAIPNLDIAKDLTTTCTTATALCMETLVQFDDRFGLQPLLASSWARKDPLTYVYTIRKGVKFWDGTPLTADDVAFSLGRHLDPKLASQLGSYYASVKSVKVGAPGTVVVKLKTPDPSWQYIPGVVSIIPKAFTQKQGKAFGVPGSKISVMGTGPYTITAYSASKGLTLKRNPSYWGAAPPFDTLELKFIEDPSTRLLAMRSGDIEGSFDVPLDQGDQWSRTPHTTTLYAPGLRSWFLSFDLSQAPWNDIHVRRAFAYAANRSGIVKDLLKGHGQVANSISPPSQWVGLASKSEISSIFGKLPKYTYNMDKAKQELAQSGSPNGFSVTVPFPDAFPTLGKVLQVLAQDLKDLKIELTPKQVPYAQYLAPAFAHKNLGLQLFGYAPDYPDPQNYLVVFLPSKNATANAFNLANYKNATVDKLLDQQAKASSKSKRISLMAQVLQHASADLPYVPLYWEDTAMAINSKYRYTGFNGLWYDQQWVRHIKGA